jgi:HSP20 family protein
MAIVRYTAYPLTNLHNQINRMFDQFDETLENSGAGAALNGGIFRPAVDVREDADAYTVHMEVPGVPLENLDISMQENTLMIRGRKEQNSQNAQCQYRRVERSYGAFSRALSLPRHVDGAKVSAHLNDGVLEISLPKLESSRPRQINIGVTKQAAVSSDTKPDNSNGTADDSNSPSPPAADELPINEPTPSEAAEPEGHPS